ncbi:hypothetical protein AZI86_11285 [Bdellovibrio bacteriovorus]|uniref:Uncharacterized protein n=1 Tax=Bdellovibrio bacteriovorus TaxID=959 RepID=A0A150WLC1_BDEBC|nr:amidoligase family protein [Bdellovibrio bacteriovorus]KYG64780.1 hypothetical protein AZI86_11285 [Bdellovibrio bacteriovorus]
MKTAAMTFLLLCLSVGAQAQQLMKFAHDEAFDADKAPRVGIEVEMSGLRTKEIALIVQKKIGGEIQIVPNEYGVPEYHLQKSAIGRVVVKPEDNGSSAIGNLEEAYEKTLITEIVTDPIHYADVEKLQKAMDALKASGAKGTADGLAVSIQVNVEIAQGDRSKATPQEIIDLIKTYLSPENRKDIAATYQVPEFRRKYLGDFSPGFMKLINQPHYNPTWREFYNDFMYRQGAEVMGIEGAWKSPISQVKKEVMYKLHAEGFDKILPVMKWNYLRLSSMMMYMMPQDPLSKFLVETTWFKGYPLFENREPNNNFNVVKAVRETLGLKRLSETVGFFRVNHPEDYQKFLSIKARACSAVFAGH